MKIGIDAMGGDFAPEAIVEGAVLAAANLPTNVQLVLIGKQDIVNQLVTKYGYQGSQIEVVHAEDVVEMGEHPTKALSQKPHSSISIGFKLLKEKNIDIFCGAGNTGAMHVGALFSIKAIEGIIRPAIVGLVPQKKGGYAAMLDIGANADCKPEVLEQFGVIGSIYAQYTFGIDKPRVALMNIGEEEQKGSLVAQAAHQLLKENNRINFVGNMEGGDFFDDKADVIITDGFTGNALFKLAESFYTVASERGIKDDYIDKMNYEAVGGSSIVGVNGNVMIAHGISSPTAIKNMITWACKQVEAQIHVHIAKALS
ncbi:glycerol-3-phosphate acyltransferase PlsX [Runella defluvii]|uniref:Phosphate acyltransferase n=1 Tax=Runella defluvii TaxID=370973 RepID=A0A7W5ZP72_9BACT|nr:phosphate acyltransferase PlsX [Runella defluvii]MBB3839202.1 glycerol-3-phosphate acyltransferase PlsX [Runella defluvii]MCA0233520.1 phosphate acyltransferase PlsX [Bacteroidota bacterium]HAK75916.1 phosphate acyltransferase PlsX [Runella sp.]